MQTLKFAVYDVDDKHHIEDTQKHDFIGAVECTLADIVAAGQKYQRTLRIGGICIDILINKIFHYFII